MKSIFKQTLVIGMVLGTAKAMALQVVGVVVLSVSAVVAVPLLGGSYSSSKNAGTFPEVVKSGDQSIQEVEKFIGVKLKREVLIGARAEAQTFLALNEPVEALGPQYPLLTAAIEEAQGQAEPQGLIVNPHSVTEVIANYTE
jgi:hypothetical protein